ncbi:long-chain-fatty-acid--CoA ligase [Erythrobacter sp.]|jgi:long-chain acyl-CoA synthetase|uniref:long-chain-fatty-acid--CoA ligase n=1 Tax=Erythrobacter sp. TaxID=1042 RepID=UPI002EBF24CA|nr:long-chain-fatty-acid--CoA ligase [Erythrobacter sp.]
MAQGAKQDEAGAVITDLTGMAARWAIETPGKTALVHGDTSLTYAELDRVSRQCAAALAASGIGRGDRVAYIGLNAIDYVMLMLGSWRVGAIMVAVNWRLSDREVDYILSDADAKLLLMQDAVADKAQTWLAKSGAIALSTHSAHGDLPPFGDWIDSFEPLEHAIDAAPGDVALQLYTSGTTGHPKGALLTHGSLAAAMSQGVKIEQDWAQWRPSDVSLVAMPMFHIGGTAWTMSTLNGGGTAVILDQPDIGDIIRTVDEHGITKLFAVPAVLNMILNHEAAKGADLGSVRALLYGASPIPPDVLRRSMRAFHQAQFVQMYGATETSGTIVFLPPTDHSPDGTPRMAGCGRPYPDVELRIVDEADEEVPVGTVGEVVVRSPLTMRGYHNLPEANEAAFRGGWYHTGDAGYLDEDGYLYLYDRVKDMIVSGAENIYPAEVENALHEHAAVRDCAVIGVPDDKWGEAVKAIVVLTQPRAADEAELIAFARERIAGFKCPKSVDFVDDLPRNPSGKILKKELRKPFWDGAQRQIG